MILGILICFSLFACGTDPCAECTDSDSDGRCDTCGEKVDTPPCDTCIDSDGDGKCDVCGETVEPEPTADIPLIVDGEAKFQVVFGSDVDSDVRKSVSKYIQSALRTNHKIEIKTVDEGSKGDTVQDIEILIGSVSTRGEKYEYDRYSLGKEGYIIKLIDSKVLINAGSNESLADIIESFAEEVLKVNSKKLTDISATAADEKRKVQTDYKITSLSVNGTDMRDYTIAIDTSNNTDILIAKFLQDEIYTRCGYYLEIVDKKNASEGSLLIGRSAEKIYGAESFKIAASGKNLMISYSFDNLAESAAAQFAVSTFTNGEGAIDFAGTVYTEDISVVYYEDFGAVGDGVADDFEAIYNAHKFANEGGQTVKALKNGKTATYYLKTSYFQTADELRPSVHSITIKTDTDFCGASFIIDDRDLLGYDPRSIAQPGKSMASASVFLIMPDDEHLGITLSDPEVLEELTASGINPKTAKIDINKHLDGWDGAVMIIPKNASHKISRAKGHSSYQGAAMTEVILLDENGNVSPDTPIMFHYTEVTSVDVYKLDETAAITVKNGKMTTRATQFNSVYYDSETGEYKRNETGLVRNFEVRRAFTTVTDLEHYVTDEMPIKKQVDENGNVVGCAPIYYPGFFNARYTTDVTFADCTVTGKRCYLRPEGGTNGTYDISAIYASNVTFERCNQTNFWVTVDPDTFEINAATANTPSAVTGMSPIYYNGKRLQMHWGVCLTSYVKNFAFVDSTLSRLDAHTPMYGGKVINSTVNYIELTGCGDFLFENSTWYQSSSHVAFMALRGEYGYTWDGTITIKNSKAFVADPLDSGVNPKLLNHSYVNWYYGYSTAVPSLSIDGLMLYDIAYIKGDRLLPEGTRIDILTSVTPTTAMHLADSGVATIWSITDDDGDGYIDEPCYDRDGDGIIDGPTDLDEDERIGNTRYELFEVETQNELYNGYADTSYVTVNINRIKPPEFIRVVNNTGGYIYNVRSTANRGISDGGWYRKDGEEDTMGGFFGGTKFIYGDGEDEYFLGSDHISQNKTKTFYFY